MDTQHEVVIINNNIIDDKQVIVKGKRTKRQRPQSPIPFRMSTTEKLNYNSSKSDDGSDICSNNNEVVDEAATTTPTFSDEEANAYYHGLTNTCLNEEEEELAHCLILLAQGHPAKLERKSKELSLFDTTNKLNNKIAVPATKFTSRKFLETPTITGKSGYYVYECKTCSKTFASFQALGGHRASHKKPKNNRDDDESSGIRRKYNNNILSITTTNNQNYNNTSTNNNCTFMSSSNEDNLTFTKSSMIKKNNPSLPLSLQLTNRSLDHKNNFGGKARVHECSICGAEFSSGQALGGHMRRHRGLVNGAVVAARPISVMVPLIAVEADDNHQMEDMLVHMDQPPPNIIHNNNNINSMLSLEIDLNLPAPIEEVGDSKKENILVFKAPQKQDDQQDNQQQQQPLFSPPTQNYPPPPQQHVFSPTPLVDCPYQF